MQKLIQTTEEKYFEDEKRHETFQFNFPTKKLSNKMLFIRQEIRIQVRSQYKT